jgi:hypothetical protein
VMDELVWIKAIPYRIVEPEGRGGAQAFLDGRPIAGSDDPDRVWALGFVLLACLNDAERQWKGTGRGTTRSVDQPAVAVAVPVPDRGGGG